MTTSDSLHMAPDSFSPFVEISLDNLLHNLGEIRSTLRPGQSVLAVVKDCAYGCGSVEIARALEEHGDIAHFAVARPEEAFVLRGAGISGTILVLGRATGSQVRQGVEQRLVFTLNDLEDLELWSSLDVPVRFHCLFDTGMSRMGLLPHEADALGEFLTRSPRLTLEGVFTHCACADEPGTPTVSRQLERFGKARARLDHYRLAPYQVHYSNSAALMRFPCTDATLVRPGIALYGCKPDPAQRFTLDLRPVASLKSRVVKLKRVGAQTPVSYGGHYVTSGETFIATVGLGYGHGLPRYVSDRGSILINGKRYRIAGNVTMDYVMVDAGPAPEFKVGDEAVAIGVQGDEAISPDEIARTGATIGYEILCNLGTSIPRRYHLKGKTVFHDGAIF